MAEKIEVAELTAVDTETTSLDALAAELVGISLSVNQAKLVTFQLHIAMVRCN